MSTQLKTRPPNHLPIEMAENQLAINLAAAGRIGLVIPDDVVHQAEHVVR